VGSLVIEVGQVVIPGRVPDATDVVLNSLGVALSSALVARWDARRTPRHDSLDT
jgi:VanZ family protein